ncbi:hypothetical protein Cfast33896_12680 [Coprobacter fastidiosus]|nr:hypothetical protein Cfast33896_12680 [Coprobacter fastidiosus]
MFGYFLLENLNGIEGLVIGAAGKHKFDYICLPAAPINIIVLLNRYNSFQKAVDFLLK